MNLSAASTEGVLSFKNLDAAIQLTVHQFSESLGIAIDAKDSYTKRHSVEVAEIAYLLADALALPEARADQIHIGGHLHDIGKIGVPNSILHKKGPLTKAEWAIMRQHPRIGADILSPVEAIAATGIPEMVLHHHEAFDGSGYPAGLKGEAIPLGARIIAVADSLSAMLSHRPYKLSKRFNGAMAEIAKCAGRQFDPRVVNALLANQAPVRATLDRLNSPPQPRLIPRGTEKPEKRGTINCRSRLATGNPAREAINAVLSQRI